MPPSRLQVQHIHVLAQLQVGLLSPMRCSSIVYWTEAFGV